MRSWHRLHRRSPAARDPGGTMSTPDEPQNPYDPQGQPVEPPAQPPAQPQEPTVPQAPPAPPSPYGAPPAGPGAPQYPPAPSPYGRPQRPAVRAAQPRSTAAPASAVRGSRSTVSRRRTVSRGSPTAPRRSTGRTRSTEPGGLPRRLRSVLVRRQVNKNALGTWVTGRRQPRCLPRARQLPVSSLSRPSFSARALAQGSPARRGDQSQDGRPRRTGPWHRRSRDGVTCGSSTSGTDFGCSDYNL